MADETQEEGHGLLIIWDKRIVYVILAACLIITIFFFSNESISVPKYPLFFFVALCAWIAIDQSWEAFKRKGKAFVCDLELTKGGHSTGHFYDHRMANRFDRDGSKITAFSCYALGGFYYSGVGVEGSDAFIVVPPEQVIDVEAGTICFTKLFNVELDELPDYIKNELLKLKGFNPKVVAHRHNLYFGMCSKLDATATEVNFAAQAKFTAYNKQINYMKQLLKEYSSQNSKLAKRETPQIIIQGASVTQNKPVEQA